MNRKCTMCCSSRTQKETSKSKDRTVQKKNCSGCRDLLHCCKGRWFVSLSFIFSSYLHIFLQHNLIAIMMKWLYHFTTFITLRWALKVMKLFLEKICVDVKHVSSPKWTSTVDCVFKEANYNKLVADKKFHDSCLYLDPQCPSSWSSTVQYLNLKKEERKIINHCQ